MEEREYERLAAEAFGRVLDLFDDVDPDDADVDQAGDVITIDMGARGKVIINTQRPAQQLWLAGGKQAFHFSYESDSGRWVDERHGGVEMFATLRALVAAAGLKFSE